MATQNERTGRIDIEIEAIRREQEDRERKLTSLLDRVARETFKLQDAERVVQHSSRARDTLDRFRKAIINKHVAKLETLILESFPLCNET